MNSDFNSAFVISLDFELFWGVFDSRGEEYFQNIEKVHKVVPRLLELFEKYEIACTWASVGGLLARNKKELYDYAPSIRPSYENERFNSYRCVDDISDTNPDLLFAPHLISLILSTPKQELASHSFSHYYALESGQKPYQFREDLLSNIKIAGNYGITLQSFVFPRNQFNDDYLDVCENLGFSSYRGNPSHWAYKSAPRKSESILKRAFRLVDAYVPLSGTLTHEVPFGIKKKILDVPASIFFRPYSRKLSFFEGLKILRIKYSMKKAAKSNHLFHLWWHPHNFSSNIDDNFRQLETILKYFKKLECDYNMKSLTMNDFAMSVREKNV